MRTNTNAPETHSMPPLQVRPCPALYSGASSAREAHPEPVMSMVAIAEFLNGLVTVNTPTSFCAAFICASSYRGDAIKLSDKYAPGWGHHPFPSEPGYTVMDSAFATQWPAVNTVFGPTITPPHRSGGAPPVGCTNRVAYHPKTEGLSTLPPYSKTVAIQRGDVST